MYLLIDNYDSFTYNLYHYFLELGANIEVYRNDQITTQKILKKNSPTAKNTLKIMGFEEIDGTLRMVDEPVW